MLSTLVTRKNAKTLPIVVVDDASFPGWRKQQGKAVQRWLDASTFEPRGNRATLIPGARGPKLALFGSKDASPWAWAGAAQRLPPGRYRLDTELEEAAATDAAIGWALSAYQFDRYKSEAAAAPRELVWPKAADRAEVARVVEAIGLARDLINTPAGDLGPAE
ncbi:MAG TPA: leucyl aminopeptidase, partial [Myxococcales bacterium]|nr:leucyl aminopeptidase [Myxococcales bacterium]